MRKLLAAVLLAFLFPYVVTLAWTGTVEGREKRIESLNSRKILLDRGDTPAYMDMEEYLIGVLARQIPAEYEEEALKAQAIIARTYIVGLMGEDTEIAESALDLDYLEGNELVELWGDHAAENYKKLEQAVNATAGQIMEWEGKPISPLFHRASAGKTRAGGEGYPYLEALDVPEDLEADHFLQAVAFSKEEFAEKIREIPGAGEVSAETLPGDIQVLKTDGAGYVEEIQIGTKSYRGEEVQYTLGLASPCFSVEEYDGGLRVVTKGIGHGYGLSQYGAHRKAQEGWTAEEILTYFYKNIEMISV